MTIFSDFLLSAVGAWQNGWGEQQERRQELAERLKKAVANLPYEFRNASTVCFRKRFIHKGELAKLIMMDEKQEGPVSWTNDRAYAERFKGMFRPDAVCGAIFSHLPEPREVILNISELWTSAEFNLAAKSYSERCGDHAKALFNFADRQGEVILDAPLRGSEIILLTGSSSPFDQLCDEAGIDECDRGTVYRALIDKGVYPGDPQFTAEGTAQAIIARTIKRMWQRIEAVKTQKSS